jgi:hypothetical protein
LLFAGEIRVRCEGSTAAPTGLEEPRAIAVRSLGRVTPIFVERSDAAYRDGVVSRAVVDGREAGDTSRHRLARGHGNRVVTADRRRNFAEAARQKRPLETAAGLPSKTLGRENGGRLGPPSSPR